MTIRDNLSSRPGFGAGDISLFLPIRWWSKIKNTSSAKSKRDYRSGTVRTNVVSKNLIPFGIRRWRYFLFLPPPNCSAVKTKNYSNAESQKGLATIYFINSIKRFSPYIFKSWTSYREKVIFSFSNIDKNMNKFKK